MIILTNEVFIDNNGKERKLYELTITSIFHPTEVVKAYITEVENDCMHFKTLDGRNLSFSIKLPAYNTSKTKS